MTIEELHGHGMAKRAIGRQLGVDETVRYRLAHPRRAGLPDGRAKPHRAEALAAVIEAWVRPKLEDERAVTLAALHAWLCEEHAYAGSPRSLERYVRARFRGPGSGRDGGSRRRRERRGRRTERSTRGCASAASSSTCMPSTCFSTRAARRW